MIGASRDSLERVQVALRERKGDLSTLSSDVFAVASVISTEPALLQTLADGGQPVAARQAVVRDLLKGKSSNDAIDVVCDTVAARWSSGSDMVEALELLAAQAAFMAAGKKLGTVEDEVFLFGRAVDASAALQMALTDPSASVASKSALVRDLLKGKVDDLTLNVVDYFASHLRGRRIDAVIDQLSSLAAAQNDQVVAEVRSVVDLSEAQRKRLAAVLTKLTGKNVRLNVAIDASIIGGISVQIGDEVIDGTTATRLETARRALLA